MLARVALPRCCRAAATPAVAPSPLASPDLVVRHTRASPPPLRVGLPGGTLGPRLARDPAVGKAADAPLAPTVRLGGARAATLAAPASRRRPAPAGALAAAGPAGVDAWVEDESLLAALRLSRAVAAARDALRADPLSLAGARAGREQAVALAGAALPSAGADDAAVARAAGLPSPAAVRAAESAGCRAAAELLRRHLGLVKAQAARAIADAGPHARLAMEDAVQEGARGLLKAAATFEPGHGARFVTWAHTHVVKAVSRALQNEGRTVRVPAHVHDARTRLRRARSAAPAGAPAAAALAAAGLGAAQAAAVEAAFWRVASLDAPAPGSSRETRLGDGVSGAPEGDAPGGAGPSGASEAEAAARSALATALATLLPRERAVLRALFGLDAPPGAPLPTGKQVAARLGLSAPTVTRAKESALAKLRHPERAAQLRHLVATLAGGP